MKIARYFPGFVDDDDFEDYLTTVSSMEELLAIEWVDKWAKLPGFIEWYTFKNALCAVMGGNYADNLGTPCKHIIAYAYFHDDRPYLIESHGRTLPNLSDLPKTKTTKLYIKSTPK